MMSLLLISLLSMLVIAITSLCTYEILRVVWNWLPRLNIAPRARVVLILVPIFIAHILNIWVYGVAYFLIEHFERFGHLTGNIAAAALTYESFIERIYFSASTYASLGLGDIVPSKELRMLTSAEVLNGLVMIGWTVSFTYLTMERFWSLPHHSPTHPHVDMKESPMKQPSVSAHYRGKPLIPHRVLYLIILLLVIVLGGVITAKAQCIPGDLMCMTQD